MVAFSAFLLLKCTLVWQSAVQKNAPGLKKRRIFGASHIGACHRHMWAEGKNSSHTCAPLK
nr:MAG TPA: hypothetical protein [Caudoviricetes sp.]